MYCYLFMKNVVLIRHLATLKQLSCLKVMQNWTYSDLSIQLLETFLEKAHQKNQDKENESWKKLLEDRKDDNHTPSIADESQTEEKSSAMEVVEEFPNIIEADDGDDEQCAEILEVISENFKVHRSENVSQVQELFSRDNSPIILKKIASSMNMKQYFENICSAYLEMEPSLIDQTNSSFCSDFILPALMWSDYSRGIEISFSKCLNRFPESVINNVIVPLMNGPKPCPFLNFTKLKTEQKQDILDSYLLYVEHPIPEWIFQVLYVLFHSLDSKESVSDLIKYLSNSFPEHSQSINFGKLIHLACIKLNSVLSELGDDSDVLVKMLGVVLHYNETSFKITCERLLPK